MTQTGSMGLISAAFRGTPSRCNDDGGFRRHRQEPRRRVVSQFDCGDRASARASICLAESRSAILMERQVAETTCKMVDEIIENTGRFLKYAQNSTNDMDRLKRTKTIIASCIAELDLEVLEPIYREHPDLKPDFLKTSKEPE
jgi:hypothetical protein